MSVQINGHSLESRSRDLLGEINAGHDPLAVAKHHLGVCYCEYEKQQAEIERLHAKLLKTADGEHVGPGDVVYSLDGRKLVMAKYAQSGGHMAYPDVCYSTPETAEKARNQ